MKKLIKKIKGWFNRPKIKTVEVIVTDGKTCPHCGVDGVFDNFCEECLRYVSN